MFKRTTHKKKRRYDPRIKERQMAEQQAVAAYPAEISVKTLLEHGVQFGHNRAEWNPKMRPFIYMKKNGVHILDLEKSIRQWKAAREALVKTVAENGPNVLMVCTKKQGKYILEREAKKLGCHFVTTRWLGGTLSNFPTISKQIKALAGLEKFVESHQDMVTKKELGQLQKRLEKLNKEIGGLRRMKKLPALLITFDMVRDHLAIQEARRMRIPILSIVDTNGNPEIVTYPVVGNDDSVKGLGLFVTCIAQAIAEGTQKWEERKEAEAKAKAEQTAEQVTAPAAVQAPAAAPKVDRDPGLVVIQA